MADQRSRFKSGTPSGGFRGARAGQDIVPRKRAKQQFPAIGTTLQSYAQQSPRPQQAGKRLPPVPPRKSKKRSKFRSVFRIKRVIVLLLLGVLLVGGYLGFKVVYNAHKLFGGSILSVLSTTKLKGETTGRVNILLAGNSADDPGHDGADLTDSILIASIDPNDGTGFLLSVPRDLYVNIPGAGYEKINDAYVVGQNDGFSAPGYPNGGMGLLEQVIAQKFQIPIDYYALINYEALKDAVNAVGGIQVTIQSDDPRGLYDPSIDYATHGPLVRLTNGVHTLNGEQALDLARARGDAYGSYGFPASDFDRTQNQRLMLVALKSKAITAGVLGNPVRLSDLFDALGNNIKTDLTLSDVRRLYDLTKNISGSSIGSLSLNNANGVDLLQNYEADDGESALAPAAGLNNYTQIQAYVAQETSNNAVVREGASILLLNGTDTTGLAATKKTALQNLGLSVSAVADAPTNVATTQIIDNSVGKMPATRALLIKQFGTNITSVNPYPAYSTNFIVILGSDQIPQPTTGVTGN